MTMQEVPVRNGRIRHTVKAESAPLAAGNCARCSQIEAGTAESLQEVFFYVTGFGEFQNG